MLTLLRQSVGTWVAKAFIMLLVASFGVWGVSSSIVGGNAGSVVQVGDTSVTANDYVLAYERARFSISQQFGRLLTRDEAKIFGVETNVMSQLVSGAVLDENASNMGLGLSNSSLATLIGEDKAFQDSTGNFNRRALQQQLRQLNMSEADYVENRQAVAVRNQLLEGTSANTEVSQVYVNAYDKYRNEKRVFEYVTITSDMIGEKPVPTGDEIKAYYDTKKDEYIAPEYRKIIVVKLEPEDVSDPQSITDEEISEEYEERKSEFKTDEKREIQQLTLESEEQGKTVLERLKGGELFETILADLGKSEADINIGEYTQSGLPDANVGKAAFELKLNEVSEVITGIFGPVILRVTAITPETIKPLSEVEDDLRKRLALAKAGEELFDIHDRLEDERAAGDSLSDAATKVNLKIRTLDKIDATGKLVDGELIKDLPESSKLLRQAFETAEGVETDPISIGSSGFVWYEVADVFVKRQKDLDEVKDQVSQSWVKNETDSAVGKIASELEKKLKSGEDFKTIYAALFTEESSDHNIEKSAELSREDSSSELSNGAVLSGFSVGKGKTATATGVNPGEQIVLKVTSIIAGEGNSLGPDEKKQLDTALGNDLLNQMVGDLRQRTDVSVNQSAILAAQNLIR